MKRLIVIVLLCLTTLAPPFSLANEPQNGSIRHAPSVEQCRADAAAWLNLEFEKRPLSELMPMLGEVTDCMAVDPSGHSGSSFVKYQLLNLKILQQYVARMEDFISRHNLDDEFKNEDEQGKR